MTADISGSLFDVYCLSVLGVGAGLFLAMRAWRGRRRPWWRG